MPYEIERRGCDHKLSLNNEAEGSLTFQWRGALAITVHSPVVGQRTSVGATYGRSREDEQPPAAHCSAVQRNGLGRLIYLANKQVSVDANGLLNT